MFTPRCISKPQFEVAVPEAVKPPSGLRSCGNLSNVTAAIPRNVSSTWSFGSQASTSAGSSASDVARRRRARGAQVQKFLTAHDFATVHSTKEARLGRKYYPLHEAVRQKDAQMVAFLLEFGANPAVKDSAGQTPEQLARRKNLWGSHDEVLRVLGEVLRESDSESDESTSEADSEPAFGRRRNAGCC